MKNPCNWRVIYITIYNVLDERAVAFELTQVSLHLYLKYNLEIEMKTATFEHYSKISLLFFVLEMTIQPSQQKNGRQFGHQETLDEIWSTTKMVTGYLSERVQNYGYNPEAMHKEDLITVCTGKTGMAHRQQEQQKLVRVLKTHLSKGSGSSESLSSSY